MVKYFFWEKRRKKQTKNLIKFKNFLLGNVKNMLMKWNISVISLKNMFYD